MSIYIYILNDMH